MNEHASSFDSKISKIPEMTSFGLASIDSDSFFDNETDLCAFFDLNRQTLERFLVDLLYFEGDELKIFDSSTEYRVCLYIKCPERADFTVEIEETPENGSHMRVIVDESIDPLAETSSAESLAEITASSYKMSGMDSTSTLNRRIASFSGSSLTESETDEEQMYLDTSRSDEDDYVAFVEEDDDDDDEDEMHPDRELEIYYEDKLGVPVDVFMQLKLQSESLDPTKDTIPDLKRALHQWLDLNQNLKTPEYPLDTLGLNEATELIGNHVLLEASLLDCPPKKRVHFIGALERLLRFIDPKRLRKLDITQFAFPLRDSADMCLYAIGDRCRNLSYLSMRGFFLTRTEDYNALYGLFRRCRFLKSIDMTDCVVSVECCRFLIEKMRGANYGRPVVIIATNLTIDMPESSEEVAMLLAEFKEESHRVLAESKSDALK
jgi:hypothetical protein